MVGVLVLLIFASSELTIDVDRPLLPALSCVQAVLTGQGESIISVDEEQGVITTGIRLVSPEALHRIAVTDRARTAIRWTRGFYQLTIALSPGEQGGTRVRATARILGYGESDLRLMRPSPWRPLASTGHLEAGILSAITASCRVNP
ncbi:hypothetical protein [Candidatus Methylomirabilis sp.]|uniref:Uncharacterized protein n=1 Tax=Candidatus Methylomirabilis tolerans TaxID=3123416 RepID=A0AAJ1AHL9_9BACT|nr:hypothetical protein [Candidatus Methylomirabilis sp.]